MTTGLQPVLIAYLAAFVFALFVLVLGLLSRTEQTAQSLGGEVRAHNGCSLRIAGGWLARRIGYRGLYALGSVNIRR